MLFKITLAALLGAAAAGRSGSIHFDAFRNSKNCNDNEETPVPHEVGAPTGCQLMNDAHSVRPGNLPNGCKLIFYESLEDCNNDGPMSYNAEANRCLSAREEPGESSNAYMSYNSAPFKAYRATCQTMRSRFGSFCGRS